jgi:conjugal transfer pilin signal peptidase TrbI
MADPAARIDRPRFWSPARRRLYLAAILLALAVTLMQAILWWRQSHAILINASDSLPHWAFLLEKKKPLRVGELVFFKPPPSDLLATHFGPGAHLFGKRILGAPGVEVSVRDNMVFLDGELVSVAKPLTRKGVPLEPVEPGVIPYGCYFVGTDHPDGFDSRYRAIGLICRDRILGSARPIL